MNTIAMTLLYILAIFVIGGLEYKLGLFVPRQYRDRVCMGKYWKRAFPKTDKSEIREFLNIYCDSFIFHRSVGLNFSPGDGVYKIYREIYPNIGGMDSLELETLADNIESRYGIDFNQIWSTDLTLGDLFISCNSQA